MSTYNAPDDRATQVMVFIPQYWKCDSSTLDTLTVSDDLTVSGNLTLGGDLIGSACTRSVISLSSYIKYVDFRTSAKKVIVAMNGVGQSKTDSMLLLQLGSSSSAVTSGYEGMFASIYYNNAPWTPQTLVQTGVWLNSKSSGNCNMYSATCTFHHVGSNTWVWEFQGFYINGTTEELHIGSGRIVLGSTVASRIYIQGSLGSTNYSTFTSYPTNVLQGTLSVTYE